MTGFFRQPNVVARDYFLLKEYIVSNRSAEFIRKNPVLAEEIRNSRAVELICFNPRTEEHLQLIRRNTLTVQYKLKELQAIDKQIILGLAVGFAAFTLSWLLPFSTIAMLGIAYSAYQMGLRKQAYLEYTEVLENLGLCCQWAMGEDGFVPADPDARARLIACPDIQNMMKVLYPLVSPTIVAEFIDDDIESEFVTACSNLHEHGAVVDSITLDRDQTSLYYSVYGYHEGSPLAIAGGIGYTARNAYIASKNYFFSLSQERAPSSDSAGRAAVPPAADDAPVLSRAPSSSM